MHHQWPGLCDHGAGQAQSAQRPMARAGAKFFYHRAVGRQSWLLAWDALVSPQNPAQTVHRWNPSDFYCAGVPHSCSGRESDNLIPDFNNFI